MHQNSVTKQNLVTPLPPEIGVAKLSETSNEDHQEERNSVSRSEKSNSKASNQSDKLPPEFRKMKPSDNTAKSQAKMKNIAI